ncbi:MAG: hemolysin family protein [Bacteroidota bacterium]
MNNLTIVILTVLICAFFSGIEIAFITSNKLKIEMDRKQGLIYAKLFSRFARKPSGFIGAILVGNNISLVVYGMAIAFILEPWIQNISPAFILSATYIIIAQTLLSTLILLIFAEFIPKVIFGLKPILSIRIFAFPATFFYYLLYPISSVMTWASELLLTKTFKVKIRKSAPVFSRIDLENYFNEIKNQGVQEKAFEQEMQIFQNAIDFRNIRTRECMIPRNEIIAVEDDEPIESVSKKFIETGFSRILVYHENIDNITGYVHVFDMFNNPEPPFKIQKSVPIVPETTTADKLLDLFISERKGIALVVDEFGGTAGIVTLEDVMEEIFGEIVDEHDAEKLTEKALSKNEFIFSARLEVDYINSNYNLSLPEGEEYETLTGLIFHHHGSIPSLGEEIVIGHFLFKIIKASHTQIHLVRLKLNNPEN